MAPACHHLGRFARPTGMRIIVPAAAGLVVLALAGCGSASTPSGAPAAQAVTLTASASPSATAVALTCKQKYDAWKTGPAKAIETGQLEPALKKVTAAGSSEDLVLLRSSLMATGRAAVKMEAYPMPPCADPKGYYAQFLGLIQAAGDNAKASSGLGALILAEAPLEKVPAVERKLDAELKKDAAEAGK
jgi:hypothetical protein